MTTQLTRIRPNTFPTTCAVDVTPVNARGLGRTQHFSVQTNDPDIEHAILGALHFPDTHTLVVRIRTLKGRTIQAHMMVAERFGDGWMKK